MRIVFWAATVVMVIGTAPCFAQSTLTGPVETVNEPIVMTYGELTGVDAAFDILLEYYKNGERVRNVEERLEGVLDARLVGSDLEVSMAGYSNVSVTDESHSKSTSKMTCLMRTTGEQLECEQQNKVTYPLFDRQSYKTGDTMTLPFGAINGTKWDVIGKVRGKSRVGQRTVLVVEFEDTRKDQIGAMEINSELTGYAYLDLAVGHPIHMEIVADIRGPFSDHDRMLLVLRLDYAMPDAQ